MTEPTPTKLGQDSGDFLSWGYAAEVDLLPGEVPLCAWDAARSGWWAPWGILYLTNQRLVWIRWRRGLPWIPKVVLISLDDISCVETRMMFSRAFFIRLLVVHLKGDKRHLFVPMRGRPRAGEIAREITSILRERGLLQ